MTEQQFDAKVRAMESRMYRLARSMLRSDFDCADAIQNAIFAAWRKLQYLKNDSKFDCWLTRILINECRNIQRCYLKRKAEGPLEGLQLPAQASLPDPDLKTALQMLPEKLRLPLILHHVNGLSVPEISRILYLPPSTVKGRIREGLKKLRRLLEVETE